MKCIPLLTESIFPYLSADDTLQGLLGNPLRLYEFHTQESGALLPVSPFGMYNFASQDWGDKSDDGETLTLTFDIFDQRGGSFQVLQQICGRIYDMLHWQQVAITNNTVRATICKYLDATQLRDPDGIALHSVVRFTILAYPV